MNGVGIKSCDCIMCVCMRVCVYGSEHAWVRVFVCEGPHQLH